MLPKTLQNPFIKSILTIAISFVWLINGLFCKLLNFAPRHQMIVSRLLGEEHSFIFTKIIGVLEILMFVWVLTALKTRWCALIQIVVIAIMNTIEFIFVPELLLFGKANSFVAAIFICVIFFNQFFIERVAVLNANNLQV